MGGAGSRPLPAPHFPLTASWAGREEPGERVVEVERAEAVVRHHILTFTDVVIAHFADQERAARARPWPACRRAERRPSRCSGRRPAHPDHP